MFYVMKGSSYHQKLDEMIIDHNENVKMELLKIRSHYYNDKVCYHLINSRVLEAKDLKKILDDDKSSDEYTLNRYIVKIFGCENSDDGEKYIDGYAHELRGFLTEISCLRKLRLTDEQFQGCIIRALDGIVIESVLDNFRKDGLKEFCKEMM